MIKKNIGKLSVSFILFVAISIQTGQFKAHVDGWDIIGFPLVFHTSCGRCLPSVVSAGTNYLLLMLDFGMIYLLVEALVASLKTLRGKYE